MLSVGTGGHREGFRTIEAGAATWARGRRYSVVMTIAEFEILPPFVGGLLIGTAATLVLWLNGKIAGISGIVARLFTRVAADTAWRAFFTLGMVSGGCVAFRLSARAAEFESHSGGAELIAAGLCVGLGTRLGGGCTSGHGVCGIARQSRRSIIATLTFMAMAFATVWIKTHVVGRVA